MRAQANIRHEPTPINNTINEVAAPIRAEIEGATTLGFWAGLIILYLIWDMVVLKTKAVKVVEPANIRTNLYNLFMIGIASVIFINGFKVVLVKLAAWNIPGLSWLSEKLLPLFQL